MKIRLAITLMLPLVFATCALAQPASLPESLRSSETTPNEAQMGVISDYFANFVSSMKDSAKDPMAIAELRSTVVGQFGRGAAAGFRAASADAFVKKVAPVAFAESSSSIVRLNAAIVAAAIQSPAAANLYSDMCANSKYPALRYYGWKGFANIAKELMSGNANLGIMLDSMSKTVDNETSVLVLTSMIKAFAVDMDLNVPQKSLVAVRKAVLPAFTKIYAGKMQAARDGDLVACDALAAAAASLGKIYADSDLAQRTEAITLIAEAMANAAATYQEHATADPDKTQTPHPSIALLVTEGEYHIGELRKTKSYGITRAVAQMVKQPSSQVLNDVLDKVAKLQAELADMNVKKPTVLAPTPK